MKLKWFKEPHFELQTKDQIFEKSMHIIWLQTMITMSPFPSYIKLTWHYNLFKIKSPLFDVKFLVLDDFIFIKLCKNHMIESIFIKLFISGQVWHILIHKSVKKDIGMSKNGHYSLQTPYTTFVQHPTCF
jgi:hypothetical protein